MAEYKKNTDNPIAQLKLSLAETNARLSKVEKDQQKFIQEYKTKIEPGYGKADFAALLGAAAVANIGVSVLKVDETGVFILGRPVVTWKHTDPPEVRAERRFERRVNRMEATVDSFRNQLTRAEQARTRMDTARQLRDAQPQGSGLRDVYEQELRQREETLRREVESLNHAEREVGRSERKVERSRQRVVSASHRIAQAEVDAREARKRTVDTMQALNQALQTLETRVAHVQQALGP